MPARDEFSDQSFAVQLVLDHDQDPHTVAQVLVGKRPPGLYGGSDKSHLTGWRVFVEGVRNHVVGQTPHQAIQRVLALGDRAGSHRALEFASALRAVGRRKAAGTAAPVPAPAAPPVASAGDKRARGSDPREEPPVKLRRLDEAEQDEAGVQVGTPKLWHDRAVAHWAEVAGRARAYIVRGGFDTGSHLDPLEPSELRLALLQELIVAYLHYRNTLPLTAFPEVRPKGGADASAVLAAECERQLPSRQAVVAGLWGQFDAGALKELLQGQEDYLFPAGQTPDAKELYLAAVADHVYSMETSYPYATSTTEFRTYFPPLAQDPQFAEWKEGLDAALLALEDPPSPEEVTGLTREPDAEHDETGRFAVQLKVRDDGNIDKVYVGDRPSSASGRHATAWVLLCDYVRACVEGRSLNEIVKILDTEHEALTALHQGLELEGPDPFNEVNDPKSLEDVQLTIVNFLEILNSTAGAIVGTGNSDGNAEWKNRIRSGCGSTPLAALFDPLCVTTLLQPSNNRPVDPYYVLVAALRIGMHLYMAHRVYAWRMPDQDWGYILREDGLALLLATTGIDLDTSHEICTKLWPWLVPADDGDQEIFVEEAFENTFEKHRVTAQGTAEDEWQLPSQSSDSQ